QLIDRRNSLTVQLLNVQKKEAELVAAGKTATDASGELKTSHDLETALQTQIQGINQTLNTTPTTITDATALNSTAATTPNPADTTKVALSQIPKAFNDALTNALQQPTFPPAVRMDNVIDLLH